MYSFQAAVIILHIAGGGVHRAPRTGLPLPIFPWHGKKERRPAIWCRRVCVRVCVYAHVYTVTLTLLLQFNAFHREAL